MTSAVILDNIGSLEPALESTPLPPALGLFAESIIWEVIFKGSSGKELAMEDMGDFILTSRMGITSSGNDIYKL